MDICRLIFSPPYINSSIRKASMEVIYYSGKNDFDSCKKQTEKYINLIENELKKSNDAVEALENFRKPKVDDTLYSRKEAATIMETTVETIRNWERNGLLISIKSNKKILYSKNEIDFMRLIYILLNGGFNLQKIYDALLFLRDDKNNQASLALCESYEYINLDNIEKNIIERIKEVLVAANQIWGLLEENI